MNVQGHQGNSSLPLSSLSGRSYRDEEVMCWILPGFLQRQMTRDGKIATQEELPHNHHLCFEGGLFFSEGTHLNFIPLGVMVGKRWRGGVKEKKTIPPPLTLPNQ